MYARVHMRNGDCYTGITCGHEDGMLYLVSPRQITLVADDPRLDDDYLMPEDEMVSPAGSEVSAGHETVRILLLRQDDIEQIKPA